MAKKLQHLWLELRQLRLELVNCVFFAKIVFAVVEIVLDCNNCHHISQIKKKLCFRLAWECFWRQRSELAWISISSFQPLRLIDPWFDLVVLFSTRWLPWHSFRVKTNSLNSLHQDTLHLVRYHAWKIWSTHESLIYNGITSPAWI